MLRLITEGIMEKRFNIQLRKIFLEYLQSVEKWNRVELSEDNWKNLLAGLKIVAQQVENHE